MQILQNFILMKTLLLSSFRFNQPTFHSCWGQANYHTKSKLLGTNERKLL